MIKVHLKTPDHPEATLGMTTLPKPGEQIEFANGRYIVVGVVHSADSSKVTIEAVKAAADDPTWRMKLNQLVRYRTSEIRAFSPPARPRMIR